MKIRHNGFVFAFILSTFLLVACGGGGGSSSTKASQSVSFGTAPSVTVGGTGTVTATATSGLTVNFTSTTSSVCTVNGNVITGVFAGTCIIAANQSGDATYNSATQVTQSINIAYQISGIIKNIPSGTPLVLQNNGTDTTNISSGNTTFSFPTGVANGGNYNVSVFTKPGQSCTVSNGTGTVSAANVTNIIVECYWPATGSMNSPRSGHVATLLANGKVLVVGGNSGNQQYITSSAELYDPATGLWTPTGSLNNVNSVKNATLLNNGKVLVTGEKYDPTYVKLPSAELYDPTTGLWTLAANPAVISQTATLLLNGNVLIIGGWFPFNGNGYVAALSYDPATDTWTSTGTLASYADNQTVTLLANGKVLVAGGYICSTSCVGGNTSELYDPASNLWTLTGSNVDGRYSHTATLLSNGKVLVAGGNANPAILSTAELYNPSTGLWTQTTSMANGRYSHTSTKLPNGKVLVVGGFNNSVLGSAELYDPSTDLWTQTSSLANPRTSHTATLLANGKVLVVGGSNATGQALSSAELFY
jgi:N-acetylneuraminic acid mutarotase